METTVVARNLNVTARKMRLIADKMRHRDAAQTISMLPLLPQKAAGLAATALKAAINTAGGGTFVIQRIWVDEGRTLKRGIHKSHGMSRPIQKQSSHLTIVLADSDTHPQSNV